MPVYQVVERNAAVPPAEPEVVNVRIIIAPTPSQAVRFASQNRFEATPLTTMDLALKVGQGYKVETATTEPAKPAEPTPPAGAAAV